MFELTDIPNEITESNKIFQQIIIRSLKIPENFISNESQHD